MRILKTKTPIAWTKIVERSSSLHLLDRAEKIITFNCTRVVDFYYKYLVFYYPALPKVKFKTYFRLYRKFVLDTLIQKGEITLPFLGEVKVVKVYDEKFRTNYIKREDSLRINRQFKNFDYYPLTKDVEYCNGMFFYLKAETGSIKVPLSIMAKFRNQLKKDDGLYIHEYTENLR